ncbi:MAG: AI-2E family transporter, partial [Thermodesulfobacteriota bacterium]|nr:AI-2E family transporter [Thermodesulfobacteriota bacterium]
MTRNAINKTTLLLLVLVISVLFLAMVRHFLMALLLAGIFSAMAHPLYRRFEKWLGGRRSLASVTTLLVFIIVLILPLGGLLGVITTEAIKVGQSVAPLVEKLNTEPAAFPDMLSSIPFFE